MKTKRKPPIPALCRSVLRTRKKLVMTQDRFGREVGTSGMLVSKWERAVHVPTDRHHLERLRSLAAVAGLDRERKLFEGALSPLEGVEDKSPDMRILAATDHETLAVRLGSIDEWVDFFSRRAANSFAPEIDNVVHDALAPMREAIKEIMREEAGDTPITIDFCNRLALRMEMLTARKAMPHKFEVKENE
jgi:transcriptional regulator with XRE-family HTH domain